MSIKEIDIKSIIGKTIVDVEEDICKGILKIYLNDKSIIICREIYLEQGIIWEVIKE